MAQPDYCCGDCRHWNPPAPPGADCRPPGRRDFRRLCRVWVWRNDGMTRLPLTERLRLRWRALWATPRA